MADRLKNLLLFLLLAVMMALLALTFLVTVRGSAGDRILLQPAEDGENSAKELVLRAMAQPEILAVLGSDGVFLAREAADYERLYSQAEPLLQEAVGSAGELKRLTERDYIARLDTYGVLLQYHAPQPWHLMQDWSGGALSETGMAVRATAVVANDAAVSLLLTDDKGDRWLAETAASLPELAELCAAAGAPNGTLPAGSHALWRDTVLTRNAERVTELHQSPPELVTRGELSKSIQALFGMNAYLTRVYQNADGSLVYVESHNTIRLSSSGDLTYTGAESIDLELSRQGAARQAELCQKAYDLLVGLWEQSGASGRLSLEDVSLEGDSGLLRFGLQLGGMFLEREEGSWATITVQDGAVTGLTVALRLLQPGETHVLLPLCQAEAVLPVGRAHLRLRLLEEDGLFVPAICRITEG